MTIGRKTSSGDGSAGHLSDGRALRLETKPADAGGSTAVEPPAPPNDRPPIGERSETAPERPVKRERPGSASRLFLAPALGAVLVACLIVSLMWVLVIPPGQPPDENHHFAYTQRLVEGGSLPLRPDLNYTAQSSEWWQAGEYAGWENLISNPDAKASWFAADERDWSARRSAEPSRRDDGLGQNSAANNPPLYYAYGAVPYLIASGGTIVDRIYLMRLATVLLLLATVALTWGTARLIWRRSQWPAVVAASFVALEPIVVSVSSSFNPDALLMALWSGAIYVSVRLLRFGPTAGSLAGLAGLSLASVLTAPRGLPIIGGAALACLLSVVRLHAPDRARWTRRVALGAAAVGGVIAVLVFTASQLENFHNTISVQAAAERFNVRQFVSYMWQFYMPRLGFMEAAIGPPWGIEQAWLDRFWGVFGALDVTYPEKVYGVLRWVTAGIAAVVVAGVVVNAKRLWREKAIVAVLAAYALSLLVFLHVAAYVQLLGNLSDPILTGRYLMSIISVLAIAFAFAVWALPRRLAPAAAGLLIGGLFVLNVAGLGLSAFRYYA